MVNHNHETKTDLGQLARLEAKIAQILAQQTEILKLLRPDADDNGSQQVHKVTTVQHYISTSGNPTWKAFSDQDEIIYLRQAHRQLLTECGLWDELNSMQIGEQRDDLEIVVTTVPDGDFLKPVRFEWSKPGGRAGLQRLAEVVRSTDFVVIETETTDLHGYVCQIAVIAPDGEMLLHRLVKPPRLIAPGAERVHGITNEMVQNAATFADPSVDRELRAILTFVGAVVGWNVTYDREVLIRSAEHHNLTHLVDLLTAATWIDVMHPYSEHVAREWSDYHQNYKWQKLTSAAEHYGINTDGAHGALKDAQMTLAVLKAMVGG